MIKHIFFSQKIDRVVANAAEKIKKTVQLDASTVEIEERGVKLRLTVVDTPGFGDAIGKKHALKINDQFTLSTSSF